MVASIEKPILRARNADTQKLLATLTRYTRFVSVAKILLGSISLLLIGTIIVMPLLKGDKEGIRLAFSGIQNSTTIQPVMTNPSFQGIGENNQPYYVTADSATQIDAHQIVLQNMQGDMMTDNNAWLSVKAKQGLINNQTKQMQLANDVHLMHLDGYEFKTNRMHIDLNEKIASGTEKITGFGPVGTIEASGFNWNHEKKLLRFTGRVTMRIMKPHG